MSHCRPKGTERPEKRKMYNTFSLSYSNLYLAFSWGCGEDIALKTRNPDSNFGIGKNFYFYIVHLSDKKSWWKFNMGKIRTLTPTGISIENNNTARKDFGWNRFFLHNYMIKRKQYLFVFGIASLHLLVIGRTLYIANDTDHVSQARRFSTHKRNEVLFVGMWITVQQPLLQDHFHSIKPFI